MGSDKSARYFFKYAFPCSHIILMEGGISQKEFDSLKNDFIKEKIPSKEILKKIYPTAFKRIKKLAKKMNKDYWDFDVIKEYWDNEHNRLINEGEDGYDKSPESFKELCRITIAKVIYKKDDILIVENKGEKRVVFNTLVKDAKIGDKVKIHYDYAIEKIKNDNELNRK